MTETVSVVIANYNRSDMLVKAIQSALEQTYSVLEILVCDDGSTDDSREKVQALNNEKVQWIDSGKNGRPAIPRNIGLSKSKGDWIAILDNDDEWLPEKIEKQLKAAAQFSVKSVCTNAFRMKNGLRFDFFDRPSGILEFNELLIVNFVICSSMIFHRSLLNKAKSFPESKELKALEDYVLWLRISSIDNIYYLNERLVIYNDAPSSGVRKDSLGYHEQKLLVYSDFKIWAEKENFLKVPSIIATIRSIKIDRLKTKIKKLAR
ncbi:MAG: glycosyltransferase family 2 protein [Bacteroidetes bacterium]|nr:glycosyltransferase family 2 protein [Bacteroidota bacterium]